MKFMLTWTRGIFIRITQKFIKEPKIINLAFRKIFPIPYFFSYITTKRKTISRPPNFTNLALLSLGERTKILWWNDKTTFWGASSCLLSSLILCKVNLPCVFSHLWKTCHLNDQNHKIRFCVWKTQKRSLYKREELSIEEEGVGTRISSVFTRQRLGMSNSEGSKKRSRFTDFNKDKYFSFNYKSSNAKTNVSLTVLKRIVPKN